MKKVFIGLLALSLSLLGVGLWLPQTALAQTQTEQTEQLELERLLNQATQQLQQGQYKQSIAILQQALPIAQRLSLEKVEAIILSTIGVSYIAIAEPQKALEYYNLALPIVREVKDRNKEASILIDIGFVHKTIGEPQKALEYYNQALPIHKEVNDQSGEATTLANMGSVYYNIGQPQTALEYYKQALPIFKEVKNRSGEASTLNNIGFVYSAIGQPQKALEYYSQALPIFKEVKNRSGEASTLNNIGLVYADIGQPQKALDYYNQALPIFKEVKNRSGEASMLNNIGFVYSAIGQPQKALEYYKQALPIHKEVKNRSGEATTLNNIGGVYRDIGQPQTALEYYNLALPILKEVKNRSGEATTLANIGTVYNNIGQPRKALEYYNLALPILREVQNLRIEAETLASIGQVYKAIGQPQKALEYYNQSLSISKEVNNRSGEATTLIDIAGVYSNIGQPQKALEYCNQSLSISREVKDRNGEAATLNNIGFVYDDIGQPQKALEYYNQSLSISREVKDRSGEATTLNNIGGVYSAIGQPQKALEYYNQSLPISREVKDRSGEATTLNNIGKVYYDIGQPQKALEYFSQALPILREVQKRSEEAASLSNLAVLERSRGDLQAALSHIEAAIKIIETTRTSLISQEFRTSYFASKQSYYDLYIDVLMQLHKKQPSKEFNALAFQASERARARSLIDLLNESQADIRQGVDPKLLEWEKNLQFQLNALEKRRVELYSKNPTKSQIASFEREYNTLLSQQEDLKTQIRSISPRYAALTQPQPIALAEIQQQVLDDNTILLEYFLGEERSYLWAVTKSEISSYELPKNATIEAATQKFIKLVKTPKARPSEISQVGTPLSQMLLAPTAQQLGQKRLVIVSNGALQYLPFAALPAPKGSGLLLSEHEIINLPSVSTLATLRQEINGRKPAPKSLAIFADPVFSPTDDRVSQTKGRPTPNSANSESFSVQLMREASEDAGVDFDRLLGTRTEAQDIAQLLPANTRTQSLDFAANKSNVLNSDLSQYRIVHFATHGILNTTRPELSAVVLSLVDSQGRPENGFLRLNDIFNLNLPSELVVLSACQTGLGQNIKGEGLVGLTRGFMYAGTPRILASLWSVDDESTATLMTLFYKAMLEKGLPPAAALRTAQLELQKQKKWQSPYYWAAFTMQGEWK